MPKNSEHKLIESIYGVTIDLDNYSNLLRLWEDEFLGDGETADSAEQNLDPEIVENHVNRASTILELTQPLDVVELTLEQVVARKSLPTFLLSPDHIICHANDSGLAFLQSKIGDILPQAVFSIDDKQKIDRYLATLEQMEIDGILAIIQPHDEDGETTLLFALSKVRDVRLAKDYLQVAAVHVEWRHNIGAVIQKSFGLSATELDLARRYVAGERLAEIALSKNRAINTLKVQTKSLYRKMKLNSQSELVRFFSALQSFAKPEIETSQTVEMAGATLSHDNVLIRPDGGEVYYEIYGDPKGEPVLFLHDILVGTKLPKNLIGYLYAHKIKLIAPHRAGYGNSSAYKGQTRLDNFVDNMRLVLAAENIDEFKIIGLYIGSVYAYYLADALGPRVTKMRLINAYLPMTSKAQMAEIPMPIKVLVYTAQYMPHLFPFFMRIMAGQVKKLGADYAMKQYFKDSEFDLELCKDPEIAEMIKDSFHCCFGAGAVGPSQTAIDAIQYDWLGLIKKCQVQVEYVHAKDCFTTVQLVEEIYRQQKNSSFKVIDGGQLVLYKYPELVLENL